MRSTFLQVMGVLFIIFGTMALIINLTLMWGYMLLGMGFLSALILTHCVLSIVSGIKAVTTYTDRHRAAACVVWGVITIVLHIVEYLVRALVYLPKVTAWFGAKDWFILGTTFVWFIPTVLYFIAAFRFVRQK